MIKAENISKVFKEGFFSRKKLVLDNVNFELKEGSITGFLGHNGAGKTTLIKIVMSFISSTEGQVIFSKRLGERETQIFRQMGYLPERPYFYPSLTGFEFLKYMALLSGHKWTDLRPRVLELSEKLKIDHALKIKLRGYSKGMLQRIGFLANIMHKPKFLILDEPLSGLDPLGRKDYKEIIKECNKEGMTVFFSSHIVHDVEEISDDILIIEKGKIVHHGSLTNLYSLNPTLNYTIKYFNKNIYKERSIIKSDLNKTIDQMLKEKNEILEVIGGKPSLEEIVYKLKDQ